MTAAVGFGLQQPHTIDRGRTFGFPRNKKMGRGTREQKTKILKENGNATIVSFRMDRNMPILFDMLVLFSSVKLHVVES